MLKVVQFKVNPDLNCWAGRILYYSGKSDEGIRLIQHAITLDKNHKISKKFLRQVKEFKELKKVSQNLFKQAKYLESIEISRKCMAIDDLNDYYNSNILFNIAAAETNLKQNQEAIVSLFKVTQMNPRYTKAFIFRGNIYILEERYEEAIIDFKKALSLEADNNKALEGLSNAQELKTKLDQ